MKKLLIWALTLIIACMPAAACAADDYEEIIGGILAHLSNGAQLQAWLSEELSDNAGGSMDALIPPLLHMNNNLDFSNYASALEQKLEDGIKSVTTRQRSALMLAVLDPSAEISGEFADETIGKLGVMSYIFGLHLLSNGFSSEKWNIYSLIDALAGMQLADGGWAVSGAYGDPDVTAMCLQALAAVENRSEVCSGMIELALNYLSDAQLDDGGYSSYGKPACESSAQVIVALNSLGIDPLTDKRFIKNGRTALDAMLSFRLPDGSFSHTDDGKSNTMACVQALSALVSLQNPGKVFYNFSGLSAPQVKSFALPLWKMIAFAAIGLLALLGVIASLFKKRARAKRLLTVLIVCAIAGAGIWMINIESTESYYSEFESEKPVAGQVWLSIDCSLVAGRSDDGSTPADGKILPRSLVDFYEDDSVFDVLTHAARKYGIHLEYVGANADLIYVNGINYLYEYAYGDLSGWIYLANGEKQSVGCGNYPVQNGDEISWHYTLNLGEDIK